MEFGEEQMSGIDICEDNIVILDSILHSIHELNELENQHCHIIHCQSFSECWALVNHWLLDEGGTNTIYDRMARLPWMKPTGFRPISYQLGGSSTLTERLSRYLLSWDFRAPTWLQAFLEGVQPLRSCYASWVTAPQSLRLSRRRCIFNVVLDMQRCLPYTQHWAPSP